MWTKTHSVTTKAVTKEQIWKLFADVNNWNQWDDGLSWTKLNSRFESGHTIELKPKDGPKVNIRLLEVKPYERFLDQTSFPLAKMWDDHIFEETTEGLRITHTITVKGILTGLWVKLVAGKLADELPAHMQMQIETAAARY